MSKRPTSHDVARLAGVSQKTVSRVVAGGAHVSESVRLRVEKAIETLGYRPNDFARQLRPGQRPMLIGLIVGDVGNPWFSQIASTVEAIVRTQGYLLITGSTSDDPALEKAIVRRLCERRVDGLLVFPASGDHAYLRPEIAAGTSMVFMDRPADNLDAEVADGYHRDQNVFAPGVTIEDDMAVLARYSTGATMTYHLTAYAPWEGYLVMVNGSRGRLELEVVESDFSSVGSDPHGFDGDDDGIACEESW